MGVTYCKIMGVSQKFPTVTGVLWLGPWVPSQPWP